MGVLTLICNLFVPFFMLNANDFIAVIEFLAICVEVKGGGRPSSRSPWQPLGKATPTREPGAAMAATASPASAGTAKKKLMPTTTPSPSGRATPNATANATANATLGRTLASTCFYYAVQGQVRDGRMPFSRQLYVKTTYHHGPDWIFCQVATTFNPVKPHSNRLYWLLPSFPGF